MDEIIFRAYDDAVQDLLTSLGHIPGYELRWDGSVQGSDGSALVLK